MSLMCVQTSSFKEEFSRNVEEIILFLILMNGIESHIKHSVVGRRNRLSREGTGGGSKGAGHMTACRFDRTDHPFRRSLEAQRELAKQP